MTNSVTRVKRWEKLRKLIREHEKSDQIITMGFTQLLKICLELNDRIDDLEIKSDAK